MQQQLIDARAHARIPSHFHLWSWSMFRSALAVCWILWLGNDVECLESPANRRMRWNKTLNLTNGRMGVQHSPHLFGQSRMFALAEMRFLPKAHSCGCIQLFRRGDGCLKNGFVVVKWNVLYNRTTTSECRFICNNDSSQSKIIYWGLCWLTAGHQRSNTQDLLCVMLYDLMCMVLFLLMQGDH